MDLFDQGSIVNFQDRYKEYMNDPELKRLAMQMHRLVLRSPTHSVLKGDGKLETRYSHDVELKITAIRSQVKEIVADKYSDIIGKINELELKNEL